MKKYLFIMSAAAAAAALCGCAKEGSLNNDVKSDSKVFVCTIENDDATKTRLDAANKVKWEGDDRIRINGVDYKISTMSEDSTTATFIKYSDADPDPVGSTYYAFYANSKTDKTTYNAENHSYTLLSDYTFNGSNKLRMPMYAEGTSSSYEFSFKNICGVVRLQLNQDCGLKSVNSITVSSDKQLNGEFTYTKESGLSFLGSATDDNKKININFKSARELGAKELTTFSIPVPPAEHNLSVRVSDGDIVKYMTMTSAYTFSRNTLYKLSGAKLKTYTGGSLSDAI